MAKLCYLVVLVGGLLCWGKKKYYSPLVKTPDDGEDGSEDFSETQTAAEPSPRQELAHETRKLLTACKNKSYMYLHTGGA